MKKSIVGLLLALGIFFSGSSFAQSTSRYSDEPYEDQVVKRSKLNNKRLEKNLDRYEAELNLSSKQLKKIKKIDRRYSRKERRLSRRSDVKKRDIRELQEEKREAMIAVLSAEQQRTLASLSKGGILNFFRRQ